MLSLIHRARIYGFRVYYGSFARLFDETPTISRLLADRAIVSSSCNIDFHPSSSYLLVDFSSLRLSDISVTLFIFSYATRGFREVRFSLPLKFNVGSRMKQRSRYHLSRRGSIFISPELFVPFFSFSFCFVHPYLCCNK